MSLKTKSDYEVEKTSRFDGFNTIPAVEHAYRYIDVFFAATFYIFLPNLNLHNQCV